ncbi:MAG: hypothetical protein AB7I04_01805 [Pseudomonadales bacterium]
MADIFDQVVDRPNEFWLRYRDSDHPHASKIRHLFSECWDAYEQYAEEQFLVEFQGDGLFQRWWEMYLFLRLQRAGFDVSQPGSGMPDICVNWRGHRYLIECVAPSAGTGNNTIPDYESGEVHQVPHDDVVLRLTSVIDAKVKQAEDRHAKGRILDDDRYLIAADDSRLRYSGYDDYFYLQALYGVGHLQLVFDKKSGEVISESHTSRPQIANSTGAMVDVDRFANTSDYRWISGIIFCNANFGNIALYQEAPELVVAHNYRCRMKHTRRFLKHEADRFVFNGVDTVRRFRQAKSPKI